MTTATFLYPERKWAWLQPPAAPSTLQATTIGRGPVQMAADWCVIRAFELEWFYGPMGRSRSAAFPLVGVTFEVTFRVT
jgi:hypothetical protein